MGKPRPGVEAESSRRETVEERKAKTRNRRQAEGHHQPASQRNDCRSPLNAHRLSRTHRLDVLLAAPQVPRLWGQSAVRVARFPQGARPEQTRRKTRHDQGLRRCVGSVGAHSPPVEQPMCLQLLNTTELYPILFGWQGGLPTIRNSVGWYAVEPRFPGPGVPYFVSTPCHASSFTCIPLSPLHFLVHFSLVAHASSNFSLRKPQPGDDFAEDIAGGLHLATELDWRSNVRLSILIADAPCHGREYNSVIRDNYPQGCPKGRDPSKLVYQLQVRLGENGGRSQGVPEGAALNVPSVFPRTGKNCPDSLFGGLHFRLQKSTPCKENATERNTYSPSSVPIKVVQASQSSPAPYVWFCCRHENDI